MFLQAWQECDGPAPGKSAKVDFEAHLRSTEHRESGNVLIDRVAEALTVNAMRGGLGIHERVANDPLDKWAGIDLAQDESQGVSICVGQENEMPVRR